MRGLPAILILVLAPALAVPAGAESPASGRIEDPALDQIEGPILEQLEDPFFHQAEDRLSGYVFLPPDLQALQDNPFENPGLLWVEQGRLLWNEPDGPMGRSCAGCHSLVDETMHGVRARYPRFDEAAGRPIVLEESINRCRTERMEAPAWPWESTELLAMTAYVGHQSKGMPVTPRIEGPMAPWLERGEALYHQRRGQLDLSCADCHDGLVGRHLRGDMISQGQINGHPVYRMLWQTLGSVSRMIRWCQDAVRAEPYPPGSDEAVALELYMSWRGRDLPVETPAVRR